MSGSFDFGNFGSGYVVGGSPHSSIHTEVAMGDDGNIPEYNLGPLAIPVDFSSPQFHYNTVMSSPDMGALHYSQRNSPLIQATMFPALNISQSAYDQNSYYGPQNVINYNLWRPPAEAQPIAPMPTTEAASLATGTLRRVTGGGCRNNCEGRFE
jgi:hypothetical protein